MELIQLIIQGDIENVFKILPASQIDEKDSRGMNCLHFAANSGYLPIVKAILQEAKERQLVNHMLFSYLGFN
jgi:ankyrin repeat protein